MEHEELLPVIKEFLNRHVKMVLTVLDEKGAPNSSLMHYVIDDDLNFYMGTKKAFGKYQAISADPRVSIAVIQEGLDPLQVVDIQARAHEIPAEKTAETFAFFESKNSSLHYVKGAEDYVMFKHVPSAIRWLDATSGELQITDLMVGSPKK
jgi:general stress protein 26